MAASSRLARETKLEPVSDKTKQELLPKSMHALLFRKHEAALPPKLALNLCLFLLLPASFTRVGSRHESHACHGSRFLACCLLDRVAL